MAGDRVEIEKVEPLDEAALVRPHYPAAPGYPEMPAYGYGYGYGDEEEGLHLRELWRTIRKRKWLIAIIAVIITTLVTIEAYSTKSTYRASAFIELGKDSPAVRSATNGVVIQTDDADIYYPQLAINTHLFRLMSEPLLEDVVADLKLDQNPKFAESSRRSFLEAVQAILNRATFKNQEGDPPAKVGALTPDADISLARPKEESARLAPYVSMIQGGLQAEQVKETRTLKVTFTHTDPVLAAAVANGVAQDFINKTFEGKTEKFTSASKWLDTTTRELKAKVESAEQDLADYSKTHNIFSTEGKGETLTTDKLSRLHEQATRSETERILKQSVYEEVKAGRVAELPAAFSDPKLIALQNKLDELLATGEKLDLKYGPDYPQVIETRLQIKTTRAQLESSRKALEGKLKAEYELALRDERSLKIALGHAKGEAVQQNQDAIQYNIIKQEVDTAKGLYTDFLQKTSQAKVEVAQQHNNMRLIQPARAPGGPVGPARFRMIMIGFFLSLVGGVGLAYFLEYLDNTIKTVDDVGRYVRLPALGVIPAIQGHMPAKLRASRNGKKLAASNGSNNPAPEFPYSSESLALIDNRSTAAEAYRVVRTSMLLSTAGNPPKTVLVTSGQPGEGKTTTVVNTAISLAQLGASVLIIDCDLRKPAAHKVFGIDQTKGLSTYLSREMEVDSLIHKLQIPNLSLLPCGPIPPNPAELISSERMKNLLLLLAERYDHILIDSPPLIHVTDPVILSSLVDGVILVVHGGKSSRSVVQRARQELSSVGAKVFGVVLNNVDMRREGYDEYYYQRYYSNYGEKDDGRMTDDG
ncbi:MAG: polysaccharide biosynthesis tyrosine autokinase [Acidobacteriota bacterium]